METRGNIIKGLHNQRVDSTISLARTPPPKKKKKKKKNIYIYIYNGKHLYRTLHLQLLPSQPQHPVASQPTLSMLLMNSPQRFEMSTEFSWGLEGLGFI